MIFQELRAEFEKEFPEDCAESWDNTGIQCGRMDKDIQRIYIALDATDDVIEQAVAFKADLLLTHHPLIFGSLKSICPDHFIGRRLIKLIKQDMNYFAMHTNFDLKMMGELAGKRLGLSNMEILEVIHEKSSDKDGYGTIGTLPEKMTLRQCCMLVKKAFSIEQVILFGNPESTVSRAAVCPGAGKDKISCAADAGADVYISGDISHHAGIDAVANGVAVIDAGHYGLEKIFIPYMEQKLGSRFQVKAAEDCSPFLFI